MHIGYACGIQRCSYCFMMNHDIALFSFIDHTIPDPLRIRRSTASVMKKATLVHIHMPALLAMAKTLKTRIKKHLLLSEAQFGKTTLSAQRVFLQDTVNYCFWSKKSEPKWAIEYPKGTMVDGWDGLVACFDRALEEGIPILDASYLKHLTLPDARHIFRSSTAAPIPLLKQRIACLREAGHVLLHVYKGDIQYLLRQSHFHADTIALQIVRHFPSFEDSATYNGKPVYFYKRAQIAAYDFSLLPSVSIDRLERLTIFADYKLPQLLRAYGVVEYAEPLAPCVDSMTLLIQGSPWEVEIRAATVWAGELLAQTMGETPAVVDNALWSMREEVDRLLPYHRCLTTSY